MLCTFSPMHIRPLICVEVGSGSGVVLAFLATLLKIPAFFWQVVLNKIKKYHAISIVIKTKSFA